MKRLIAGVLVLFAAAAYASAQKDSDFVTAIVADNSHIAITGV